MCAGAYQYLLIAVGSMHIDRLTAYVETSAVAQQHIHLPSCFLQLDPTVASIFVRSKQQE
jgi:hypothetical protein